MDATVRDDGSALTDSGLPPGRCGNSELNTGEECDDGNRDPDDGCSADCQLECGDGTVSGDELCDTAIASGEAGACPSDCDDADACTTDALDGTGCSTECSHAPISTAANGDGCCPAGADASTDDDCVSSCGNSILEPGELCEDGSAAACPTACDDSNTCTADVLSGAASTCDAECSYTDITACSTTSDGCCPAACDATTDADCSGSCGNGVFEPPVETCENGTSTPCPSTCSDGMACTTDALSGSAAACNVQCTFTPITACSTTSDGCCPGGCNASNDADCVPRCGNGTIEGTEQCDDGNTTSGDGCSATCRAETVGYRFSDLDIRDPHLFANVTIIGTSCRDVTNGLFGQAINDQLQRSIQNDTDPAGPVGPDGLLDLSLVHAFTPLVQGAGTSTMSVLTFPDCTAPMSSTSCTLAAGAARTVAPSMNRGGGAVCLQPVAGTTSGYTPAITNPTAPAGGTCYVASTASVTFTLSGIPITLLDAHIGGEWFGAPATEIRDGLISGFLTETTANATIIPAGTTGQAGIDGMPLSALLRGGTGACSQPAPMTGDKDTYMGMSGWYFYLNFRATRVPYTEL